jgi:hypothetical protein
MIFFVLCNEDQSQMQQSDRLDDAWKNHMNTFHMNENRLTQRNVPRLILSSNDCKLIYFDMSFEN